jgi:hypothetical protein
MAYRMPNLHPAMKSPTRKSIKLRHSLSIQDQINMATAPLCMDKETFGVSYLAKQSLS